MAKHKIVIADDDKDLAEGLAIRLSAKGYEVHCAQDGYQTIVLSREKMPDLLMLDINMPAGDGFNVLERIQRMEQAGDMNPIPVIYLTGDTSEKVKLLAMEHGAFGILHKPFNFDGLLEMVRKAIDSREEAA